MVRIVLNESEHVSLLETQEYRDGPDLRMSRKMVYGLCNDKAEFLSPCDQLWYSSLVDAKIILQDGTYVTLRIADPVVLVHEKGMVIFAHCGYTPSFHLGLEKLTYASLGGCSLKIKSENCRSFADTGKMHAIDMYLTTLPEDEGILTTLIDHLLENERLQKCQ